MSKSRALNIPAVSTGHQNLPVYSLNHSLQLLNKSSNNYSRKRHYSGDPSDSSDTVRFCWRSERCVPALRNAEHLSVAIHQPSSRVNRCTRSSPLQYHCENSRGHSIWQFRYRPQRRRRTRFYYSYGLHCHQTPRCRWSLQGRCHWLLNGWKGCADPGLGLPAAGTQSAIGDDVVLPPRDVLEGAAGSNDVPPTEQEMHGLFFYPSETSLAAGKDWWKRIHERQMDGDERKELLVGQLGHSWRLFSLSLWTLTTLTASKISRLQLRWRMVTPTLCRPLPTVLFYNKRSAMLSLLSTPTRDMATCSSTLSSTHSISSSSWTIYRRLKLNHGYKYSTISGLDELNPTPYQFFFIIVINYTEVLKVKDVNIIGCVINIRPTDTAGTINFHLL